jgi:hypothetical protein
MKNKRSIAVLRAAVLLTVSVAAFVGGRLLIRQLNPMDNQTFIIAEELPQSAPIIFGLFVRREDNSIFLGTGGISVDSGANGEPIASYNGPVIEILVNTRTNLYREIPPLITFDEIHQQVAEGRIDELNETTRLTIWGRKTGDRIIAEALLYSSALSFYSDGRRPQPRLSSP